MEKKQLSAGVTEKLKQLINLLTETIRQYQKVVLATSLGIEDVILMEAIFRHKLPIAMFVLETGRLPEETLILLQDLQTRYQGTIRIYFPDRKLVESYVKTHGINAFYQSVDLRKRCCYIRKVEPLKRALSGYKAWLTGIRKQQSIERYDLALKIRDQQHQLDKINPLIDWSEKEIWELAHYWKVPYNKLHDQHYPSIGCAPCSRPVTKGEDIRAGRWWWEQESAKECGLHSNISMLKK